VGFATEDGELIFGLSVWKRWLENIIRDAGWDPAVSLEEDLLGFRLETLDYGLQFEY
jgi:hypothetical protein